MPISTRERRRRIKWGALAAVLIAAPAPLHAQATYPLAPAGDGGGQAAPAPVHTSPQAILPQLEQLQGGFRELDAGEAERVVGGRPASHAEWKSFVLINSRMSSGRTSTCGGTVIARQWVLTAGHCVVGRGASSFTVIEGIDDLKAGGRKITVDRVLLHENYADRPPRNDVALLHLVSPAHSPRQALVSEALSKRLLRGGTTSLLAGFGLTSVQPLTGEHTGSISNHLLQVHLPIVERPTCKRILAKAFDEPLTKLGFLDESAVCAGDPEHGGRDACNGDSGGPLAIDVRRRRVQVGVVSWGPGCGLRNTVGVYASVGHFEDWIRRYATEVRFLAREEEGEEEEATPSPDASSEAPPAAVAQGESCGLPPRPSDEGVRVEIVEGSRVRIGEPIHVRATPNVPGQLLIFNVDLASCRSFQLFPNKYSSGAGIGSMIAAGASASVPAASDSFAIRVSPPVGGNRLYALIVPPSVQIDDLAARGVDMKSFDTSAFWRELSMRTTRNGAPRVEAIGVFDYEIIQ